MKAPECGLITTQNQQIPLQGVAVSATISGRCAEVSVSHRYKNMEKVDVEAVYVFPLEDGAAVSAFRARVGDRLIEGRVEEREEAFEIYDDAMADGHGAFLLDQERPNIFTASVGNIKPDTEVIVEVAYVALLNYEGSAVRMMLPTTISPRYVPAGPPEVGQPDAERISPPTLAAVPYGLTLEVVVVGDGLRSVESPSHPVRTRFEDGRAVVSLSSQDAALDRDFVLMVEPKDAHAPKAVVAREADGTRVAMVTFHPDPDATSEGPADVTFVVDCSGSMGGDSIEQAKRAMALCVRALAEGDRFNIVRFGSSYTMMWTEPKTYSQATLEEATRYIDTIWADMGGTEVLAPLQAILTAPVAARHVRQVLLLTDGEVSNEDQVIALCQERRATSRVFTFGIGAGASEHLVRGIARASGGAAEFIYPGERIESKVLRMFGRLKTPVYADIRVDWAGMEVEQAPASVPPLFAGDAVTLLGRIRHGAATTVTLKAGDKSWSLPIDLEQAELDGPVPKLWARLAIRDLEEGKGGRSGSNQARGKTEDRRTKRLVELGKKYGLMTSATSYVAIEVRSEEDKTVGQAQLRRVPVALTAGWGGQGSVVSSGGHAAAKGAAGPPMSKAKRAPVPMAPPSMPMAPPSMPMAPPPPSVQPVVLARAMSESAARPSPPMAPMQASAPGAPAPRPAPAPARGGAPSGGGGVLGAIGGLMDRLTGGGARDESRSRKAEADQGATLDWMEVEEKAHGDGADVLFDLLLEQRADGSFTLSAALRRYLAATWTQIQAAAKAHGEQRVATTLVLTVLERKAADRKAEWSAAARKAEAWLAKQGGRVEVSGLM